MLGIIQSRSFPCWSAPGYDPNHIAALGTQFSGVASGASLINLLTGGAGPISAGAPTFAMKNIIGPALSLGAATDLVKFTSIGKQINVSTTGPGITLAFIGQMNVATGFLSISWLGTSGGNNGGIQQGSGKFALTTGGGPFISSNLSVVANQPVFFAASGSGTGTNFVLRNLANGAINSSTGATALNATGGLVTDRTIWFGPAGSQGATNGLIAAAMASAVAQPLSTLLAWAEDPWSFWYPPSFDAYVGVASVVTATIQSNLLLMGAG